MPFTGLPVCVCDLVCGRTTVVDYWLLTQCKSYRIIECKYCGAWRKTESKSYELDKLKRKPEPSPSKPKSHLGD